LFLNDFSLQPGTGQILHGEQALNNGFSLIPVAANYPPGVWNNYCHTDFV
jgi:hypothetical protein